MSEVSLFDYDVTAKVDVLNEYESYQNHLMNVDEAWKKTLGEGVRVAVLDTGEPKHPDLNVIASANFVPNESHVDSQGHSTHCCGILSAKHDGVGVSGIAPNCELFTGKVLSDNGFGKWSYLRDGILWAIDNDVDIISMSLGGPNWHSGVSDAISRAHDAGITIICATGNNKLKDKISFPAKHKSVIAVAAINRKKHHAEFSNAGDDVDFATGGVNIWSTYVQDGKHIYAKLSGTSMATPAIAGIATLIISYNRKFGRKLLPETVKAEIESIATDIDNKGFDDRTGFGLPVYRKSTLSRRKKPENIIEWVKSLFS